MFNHVQIAQEQSFKIRSFPLRLVRCVSIRNVGAFYLTWEAVKIFGGVGQCWRWHHSFMRDRHMTLCYNNNIDNSLSIHANI